MAFEWDEGKRRYLAGLAARGVALTLEARRGARWATSGRGVVGILGASEVSSGERWFLGLNEAQFRERQAIGVILLCERGDEMLDFGLPAGRLLVFLGRLSEVGGERKINLVRSRDRYIIQVPGATGEDVSEALGNLDWLLAPAGGPAHRPEPAPARRTAKPGRHGRFFAKVTRGRLQPLDPIDLKEGEVLLVRTERVPAAPRHASLRRILALGGPGDLPADLAARHDRYAHGAAGQ